MFVLVSPLLANLFYSPLLFPLAPLLYDERLLTSLCPFLSIFLGLFRSLHSTVMRSPNPDSAERYTLYSDSPSSRYEKPKRSYQGSRKLHSARSAPSEVADDRSYYSASTAADEYKNRYAYEPTTPRSAKVRSPSVLPDLPVEEPPEKGRWVRLISDFP